MSNETIPLNLFKANLELQLRLQRLVQETGQQWLENATRAGKDGIAEIAARNINAKVGRDMVVGVYPPPFDFDRAMAVLKHYRGRRDDSPLNRGRRPLTRVTIDETNAALLRALKAVERRIARRKAD